jgi:hypothetical protein
MKKEYLKDNPRLRKKLKVGGFICLISGLLCMLIAFIDFFGSIGSFDPPSLFWLFFIGMPLTFVGSVLLSYSYMGQVARYTSSQVAPVVKDTTNYLIDGTKDEIVDLVQGIRGQQGKCKCPFCGDENDADAIYCDYCGKKLKKTCTCGEVNAADSRFCKRCGRQL